MKRGSQFERRIANYLRRFGFQAKRNLEEVRTGRTTDVIVWDDQGELPVAIECRHRKHVSFARAVSDAELEAGEAKIPVAVVCTQRKTYLVLPLWMLPVIVSQSRSLVEELRKQRLSSRICDDLVDSNSTAKGDSRSSHIQENSSEENRE